MRRMEGFKIRKKGQMKKIREYILIIVAGIILFIVFGYVLVFGKGVTDTEACRLSALAKWKISVADMDSLLFDLQCRTDFITVYSDRIEKNDDVLQKLDSRIEERQVKRVIANEMYDCWYQMGAGDFDLFGHFTGDTNCLLCAYIDFDESFRDKHSEIKDFNKFLGKKVPGKRESYISYLTKGTVNEDDDLAQIPTNIRTNEGYSVVFMSINKRFFAEATTSAAVGVGLCKVLGAGGAAVGGAVAGVPTLGLLAAPGAAIGGAVGCAGGLVVGVVTYVKWTAEQRKEPRFVSAVLIPTELIGDKCEIMH